MPSMKIHTKFNSEEARIVAEFANMLGVSLEELVRRSVFYAINDASARAEALREKQSHVEQAASTISESDNRADQADAEAVDSSSLADTETVADSST